MARINVAANQPVGPVTHEGAPAKRITPEQELRRTALACLLWEDSFYENGKSIAERLVELCLTVDPEAIARIAVEARGPMKLRHLPLYLCVQLARRKALKAETLASVIQRADELAEFVALYWQHGKLPLAAQVKKGLATAFQKFNAYSLAKYNQDGPVKLRDVLFMVHAVPKDVEQAATWKQLVDGTLPAPDTWEVALSAGKDKQATWTRLIQENQLGALAMIRNLRNMQEAQVADDVIRQGLTQVSPERVLPYRFIAAARFAPRFEPELEALMFKAIVDQPKLPGKTMLLVDGSGSMDDRLSGKGDILRFDAAVGLAILARELCQQVEIVRFDTSPTSIPARRGFALRDAMGRPNGGTNTETAKQYADSLGYDRLIILTDEQSHQALSNPVGKGYVVNVAAYQNGIGYGHWTNITGWSEAVLSYIATAEQAGLR